MYRADAERRGCPCLCASAPHDCYFDRWALVQSRQLRVSMTSPVVVASPSDRLDEYNGVPARRRPSDVNRRFTALRLGSVPPSINRFTPPCYDEAMGCVTSSRPSRISPMRRRANLRGSHTTSARAHRHRRLLIGRSPVPLEVDISRQPGSRDPTTHHRWFPFDEVEGRPAGLSESDNDAAMAVHMGNSHARRSPPTRHLTIDNCVGNDWN